MSMEVFQELATVAGTYDMRVIEHDCLDCFAEATVLLEVLWGLRYFTREEVA
jgi:hypothetical protein